MTWPGDEHPDTLHIGGYRRDNLVGIGTIIRQPMPGSAETEAWRVRGVAVDHGHRGYGLGAMLLHRLIEHAGVNRGGRWCGPMPRRPPTGSSSTRVSGAGANHSTAGDRPALRGVRRDQHLSGGNADHLIGGSSL